MFFFVIICIFFLILIIIFQTCIFKKSLKTLKIREKLFTCGRPNENPTVGWSWPVAVDVPKSVLKSPNIFYTKV